MSLLTPSFLIDLETRMSVVAEDEYARLSSNVWYPKIMKSRPVTGRKERLIWNLSCASIDYVGRRGADVTFDSLLMRSVEYEVIPATRGFEVDRFEFSDLTAGGVSGALNWARDITAQSVYWPQKQLAKAIRDNVTAYDGLSFFNTAHPVNPFATEFGNYTNDLTGGDAVPIDTGVTLDVAFANVAKAIAKVATFKMPNGEDPRMLKVTGMMGPPALRGRIQQLTNAKIIAQAAASGGGSADVEAVISDWGLAPPIIADELGAAFGGSDTTWYLLIDPVGAAELGAFSYLEADPFGIVMNGEVTDAQLARMNKIQWLTRGRNYVAPGHPFLMIRCRAA
jgi:hypothetical protein